MESYCFGLKKRISFLTYPFSLPSPSPSPTSLLKLESDCILSWKILNSPKFLTIPCCCFIYFITASFSGKVTIQEFRKLPTAAMDDYMNRLKETSPIHRDRNSNQAWIHQGSLAGDVMKRLRRRWVFEFRKYTKVALFVFVSVSFIHIQIQFFSHFIVPRTLSFYSQNPKTNEVTWSCHPWKWTSSSKFDKNHSFMNCFSQCSFEVTLIIAN